MFMQWSSCTIVDVIVVHLKTATFVITCFLMVSSHRKWISANYQTVVIFIAALPSGARKVFEIIGLLMVSPLPWKSLSKTLYDVVQKFVDYHFCFFCSIELCGTTEGAVEVKEMKPTKVSGWL